MMIKRIRVRALFELAACLTAAFSGVRAEPGVWVDARMPGNGSVTAILSVPARSGANPVLLAGTRTGNVFRSDNDGASWNPVLRFGYEGASPIPVTGLLAAGDTVYAAFGDRPNNLGLIDCPCGSPPNQGDLFRSTDGGLTWKSTGLGGSINALAAYQGTLYAARAIGIMSSRDGVAWNLADSGKSLSIFPFSEYAILSMAPSTDGFFVSTRESVYRAAMRQGTIGNFGPAEQSGVRTLTSQGGHAVLALATGVYRSSAQGWDRISDSSFTFLTWDGTGLLGVSAAVPGSVAASQDGGATWMTVGYAPEAQVVTRHRVDFFAGTATYGPVRIYGTGFLLASIGFYDSPILSLGVAGSSLLAGTDDEPNGGLFNIGSGLPHPDWNWDLFDEFPKQRVVACGGTRNRAFFASGSVIYASGSEPFQGWTSVAAMPNGNITAAVFGENGFAAYEETAGTLMMCVEPKAGKYDCTSRTGHGLPIKVPPPPYIPGFQYPPHASHAKRLALEGDALAFVRDSVYVSEDRGATWANRGPIPGFVANVLAFHRGSLYAAGSSHPAGSNEWHTALAISHDRGKSWSIRTPAGAGRRGSLALAFYGEKIFLAGDTGVFMQDGDKPWMRIPAQFPDFRVVELASGGNYLYAGLESGGVAALELETVGLAAAPGRGNRTLRAAPGTSLFPDARGTWRHLDGTIVRVPSSGR